MSNFNSADIAAFKDVWVFCEQREGKLMPTDFELISKGRDLANELGVNLCGLLLGGEGIENVAKELGGYGADKVIVCEHPLLATYTTDAYAKVICDVIEDLKPEAFLIGATNIGRDLGPRCAARLHTGLTADCTHLDVDVEKYKNFLRTTSNIDVDNTKFEENTNLKMTRPAFGGHLMATIICPNHRPQMATVRPGIFKAPEFDYSRSGTITQVVLADDVKARVEISIPAEEWGQQASIADAERLVVVGRGIGSKKNLPLMRKLADALGAELGCTRPIVEAGWLEYRHQIGQTGVSVSPKLLVSIGVSGAIQHLAGIGGAECIIAINEDPDAPIFGAAQYKVVGDAVEVVEELLAQFER